MRISSREAAVAAGLALVSCTSTAEQKPPVPCVADTTEPNEDVPSASNLGQIHDDDVIGQAPSATPMKIDKTFSTDSAADVDWYVVDVLDTGLGGNPELRVIVGDGHEATAFWSCTQGTTKAVACGLGEPVTDDPDLKGRGCRSVTTSASPQLTMSIECDGTSTDNGRLHIRVKKLAPSDACERYRLIVTAQ